MVDQAHIQALFDKNFIESKGRIIIHSDGKLDVIQETNGVKVTVIVKRDIYEFPIKFDVVEGNFGANSCDLRSLKGFPRIIEGDLYTKFNPHLTFDHFDIDAVEGFWSTDYRANQPYLKMLVANEIRIAGADTKMLNILNKYAGQGKKGSLACAAELADAGFKAHAQW